MPAGTDNEPVKTARRRRYSPEDRAEAGAWLQLHDQSLVGRGVAMRIAAEEFSAGFGQSVTPQFLGRVAARLRRERRLEYRGKLPPFAEFTGLQVNEWGQLVAGIQLIYWTRGRELDSRYMARLLQEGLEIRGGHDVFGRPLLDRTLIPMKFVSPQAIEALKGNLIS